MKEKEIRKLIRLVEESRISELEVSRWGRRVRIQKHDTGAPDTSATDSKTGEPLPRQTSPTEAQPSAEVEPPSVESNLIQIVSPMVGTFYRAPAPNVDPFVQVNDNVQPGQTVCIIEAMKLMNEIESEAAGRIINILVENGQPVEYNQPLFLLEPM